MLCRSLRAPVSLGARTAERYAAAVLTVGIAAGCAGSGAPALASQPAAVTSASEIDAPLSAPVRFQSEIVAFGVVDEVHALAAGPSGPILMGVRNCCKPVLWTRTADDWAGLPIHAAIGISEGFDFVTSPAVAFATFDETDGGRLLVGDAASVAPSPVAIPNVGWVGSASLRMTKDGRRVVAFDNNKHELFLAVESAGTYAQSKVASDAARPRLAVGPAGQLAVLASIGKNAVIYEAGSIDQPLRETRSSPGVGSDIAFVEDGTLLVLLHTATSYTLATRSIGGQFEEEVLPLDGGWMGGRLAIDERGRVAVAAEQVDSADSPTLQTLQVAVRDPGQKRFVRADLGAEPLLIGRAPTVAFDAAGRILIGAVIETNLTLLTEVRQGDPAPRPTLHTAVHRCVPAFREQLTEALVDRDASVAFSPVACNLVRARPSAAMPFAKAACDAGSAEACVLAASLTGPPEWFQARELEVYVPRPGFWSSFWYKANPEPMGDVDVAGARQLLQVACKRGLSTGCAGVAESFGVKVDPGESNAVTAERRRALRRACETGFGLSCRTLLQLHKAELEAPELDAILDGEKRTCAGDRAPISAHDANRAASCLALSALVERKLTTENLAGPVPANLERACALGSQIACAKQVYAHVKGTHRLPTAALATIAEVLKDPRGPDPFLLGAIAFLQKRGLGVQKDTAAGDELWATTCERDPDFCRWLGVGP